MTRISRFICMTVLLCFSFSATAGTMMQCLDMPQQNESSQLAADLDMADCHSDKSSDNDSDNCCIDMSSCHTSSLFLENSINTLVQIQHQHDQLPLYQGKFLNATSPPTPPPKLIS